jgi:hypothetical protein
MPARQKRWNESEREAALAWVERKSDQAILRSQEVDAGEIIERLAGVDIAAFGEAIRGILTDHGYQQMLGALRTQRSRASTATRSTPPTPGGNRARAGVSDDPRLGSTTIDGVEYDFSYVVAAAVWHDLRQYAWDSIERLSGPRLSLPEDFREKVLSATHNTGLHMIVTAHPDLDEEWFDKTVNEVIDIHEDAFRDLRESLARNHGEEDEAEED